MGGRVEIEFELKIICFDTMIIIDCLKSLKNHSSYKKNKEERKYKSLWGLTLWSTSME
jgi:hypothetical protein